MSELEYMINSCCAWLENHKDHPYYCELNAEYCEFMKYLIKTERGYQWNGTSGKSFGEAKQQLHQKVAKVVYMFHQ